MMAVVVISSLGFSAIGLDYGCLVHGSYLQCGKAMGFHTEGCHPQWFGLWCPWFGLVFVGLLGCSLFVLP